MLHMYAAYDCCYIALTKKTPLLCFGALGLGDPDVAEICKALKENSTVEELQFFSNDIARSGAYSIAALIISNPNIKSVDLSGNKIDQDGQNAIYQAIEKSQRVVKVNFDGNLVETPSQSYGAG